MTDGLSKVCPHKLVQGLASIQHIKLREAGLTVEQIDLLMLEIMRSNTIKSLDIIDKNISMANMENMVAAFISLESLSLHYGTLIGDRTIDTFLRQMGTSQSRLVELSLRNISLSHVDPLVLGLAVKNLQSLEIMISDLSSIQLDFIFTTFAKRKHQGLKHLRLSYNDLSLLSASLFVDVCQNCQVLEVFNAKVTTEQMEGLFKCLATSTNSTLQELNVNYNDLSQVSPDVLAQGVNKLHKAFLYKTELSEEQISKVLDYGMKQSKLFHLDLRYNVKRNSSCHLTRYLRSHVYKIEI